MLNKEDLIKTIAMRYYYRVTKKIVRDHVKHRKIRKHPKLDTYEDIMDYCRKHHPLIKFIDKYF